MQMHHSEVASQSRLFWQDPARGGPGEDTQREASEGRRETPQRAPIDRTVLYIEDNLSNVRLIERVLTRRPGVRLVPAMQGNIGLDLAREHLPDLILLDVQLPDISGQEVLRRLRESPKTSGIPVVVMSADASPHTIEQLLSEGARDFLTKPVDVKRFFEIVDLILESERRPVAVPSLSGN